MVDKWKEQKYIYKSKIEKKKEKPTYPFQLSLRMVWKT